MRCQRLLAAEGVAARIGLDLRAVQRHPLQGDQTLGAQHPQYLREQIVQRRLLTGTKPRQRAVTDRLQPAQPLQRRFIFAPPRHLARRADPAAVGIQPQTDQNLRIGMLSPRPALHRGDRGIIPAQIQPPHQLPNRPRRVIFLNQSLHIDRPHHHLPPIHWRQTGTSNPIVGAHASNVPEPRSLSYINFNSFLILSHVPDAVSGAGALLSITTAESFQL